MKAPKLQTLTSLRFVAAAMILFHHTRGYLAANPDWAERLPFDHGVSFFFVLSGFILAYSYPTLQNRGEESRFLFARFARLWPVHIFCLMILFLGLPLSSLTTTPLELLWITPLNLTLIHAWIPSRSAYFSLNGVSWSISTELFFYLCFPVLIRDWSSAWAKKLMLTFVVLTSTVLCGNWLGLPGLSNESSGLTTHWLVFINPIARLFEFVLGMSSLILWRRLRSCSPISLWKGTAVEAAVLLVVFGWILRQPLSIAIGHMVGDSGREYLGHAGSGFAFALLIPIMALERGLISRLLSIRPLVILGEISFSVYLLHQVILRIITYRLPSTFSQLSPMGLCLLWVIIILAAYLVWRFVETPCQQFLLNKWDARAHHKGIQKREANRSRSTTI